MFAHRGLELLGVHHEAAVSADGKDTSLGMEQLGRECARDREAHRCEAVGYEAGLRLEAGILAADPDLVRANVGDEDVGAPEDLADVGNQAAGLHRERVVAALLLELSVQAGAHGKHRLRLGHLVAAGSPQDLVDAVGKVADDLYVRVVLLIDVGGQGRDVYDPHVVMGMPLLRRALDEVVAYAYDEVGHIEGVDDVIVLRNPHDAQPILVVARDDALAHHRLDHRDVKTLGHGRHRLRGVTANGACAGEDHGVLRFRDHHRSCGHARRVGIERRRLLPVERFGRARHVRDVLRQVDVGGAGLAALGVLEREPADLRDCVRPHDDLRALGYGAEHGREVEVLVARELHELTGDLPRDRDERRAVQKRVGHAGDEVRRARPERRQANTGAPGQAAVYVRHEGRALLVTRWDEANPRLLDGEHKVEVLLAGYAEDNLDPFRL